MPLLKAAFIEIKELSKKKSDGTVGTGKISILNRLLTDVRGVLAYDPTMKYLDLLDEDLLPQYSDVALLISQYVAAMDAFYNKYYKWNGIDHVWILE